MIYSPFPPETYDPPGRDALLSYAAFNQETWNLFWLSCERPDDLPSGRPQAGPTLAEASEDARNVPNADFFLLRPPAEFLGWFKGTDPTLFACSAHPGWVERVISRAKVAAERLTPATPVREGNVISVNFGGRR